MLTNLLPINSKQFESALKIRELTNRQVEEALCRSTGYISAIKKRGSINLPDAKMIEAFFDIPKEEYVTSTPEPKSKEPGVKHVKGLEIDVDQLRKAFKTRGLTLEKSSLSIGRSHAYFNHVCRAGRIQEDGMNSVKDILGIQPEEYVKKYMVEEEPAVRDIPIVIEDKKPGSTYSGKDDEPKLAALKKCHELFTNEIHNRDEKAMEQGVCVSEKPELPDIPILIEDKNNPIAMVADKVAFEPDVKAANDIPTPKFSFDRNKLRVLKRPELKEVETKKSGKYPWGESSETIHNPDMPIFVNISINVEIKSEDSKVPEIDYRRLKSDTYNAVCTGVFDGMARWNRR